MSIDDFYDNKIAGYRHYDPQNVQKDVERDLTRKSIKLFYVDLYEVPELLILDDDSRNLPPHQPISIGTGCTDPYDSDDCSQAYRAAMDKAIMYGRKYNRLIATRLKLKIKPKDREHPNPTQEFLGDDEDSGLNHFKIELSDIQPLYGGRHIWVDGSGHAFVQSVRPGEAGLEQKNYAVPLTPDEITRLVTIFITKDFLSLRNTPRTGMPDQAMPEITLENFRGETHAVWNWDPPVPGGDEAADRRFQSIYWTLLSLETKALETLEPINSGVYHIAPHDNQNPNNSA